MRKLELGALTTIAGTLTCGYSGIGGSPTAANLDHPRGVAVDQLGQVWISDSNNCVIRQVAAGVIYTIAGIGPGAGCGFNSDGNGPSVQLNHPGGLVYNGSIYFADTSNCRIRRLEASGSPTVTTVAGSGVCGFGGDGGSPTSALLNYPAGSTSIGDDIYIADTDNCRIRKATVLPPTSITTFAGNGTCGFGGDAGTATSAQLDLPSGVAVGTAGIYIGDTNNCRVRLVQSTTISTVAGNGPCAPATPTPTPTATSTPTPTATPTSTPTNTPTPVVGPVRDHKTDSNGDGYSAADEVTAANCGVASCASITTFGTAETKTCKDAGANCGTPNPPADESGPARVAVPPAGGYGCSVTLDIVGPLKTAKLAQSDVDLDGAVSILDTSKVASWFGNSVNANTGDPRWEGDMDGDGVISILDLSAIAANFGRSVANNCKIE